MKVTIYLEIKTIENQPQEMSGQQARRKAVGNLHSAGTLYIVNHTEFFKNAR